MQNIFQKHPTVLIFAGHDPSGGAGIQADIESVGIAGCHALPVITASTAQNTRMFSGFIPQDNVFFKRQIELLEDDFQIDACKIGMLGNEKLIRVIEMVLTDLKIPTVLDPVLVTGTDREVTGKKMRRLILERLLPLCSIITPNSAETRVLADTQEIAGAVDKLMEYGCAAVLVTDADEDVGQVINRLYQRNKAVMSYAWKRLPGIYHGSGCTLSSSIAAQLALGSDIESAVEIAQRYTWNALRHGRKLGGGQLQPDRFIRL